MALPEKPITRKETYLAKAAGQNVDLPPYPITREEAYLDEIAKNSGGGGGYVLPTATADRLGGVKIGSGINVEADGTISASGGGGGTSDYPDLTNKPQINGIELSGNKTASQLGMANSNTFQGTIAEWNQLTTAEKKAYDHASIPDSLDGNVTFPASKVMMNDGDSVEDRIGNILFVEKSISNKSINTAWGSMFIATEAVDISGLGLNNIPDVVSVVFGATEAITVLCAATSINKNNITVSLLRATSGTVSGKIMIMLKSNG